MVGTGVATRMLASHPLWVVALSPRTAFLLSAAPRVSFGSYLCVATVRLAAADPFSYLLGRHHCPKTISRVIPGWGRRSGPRLVLPVVALSPTGKVLAVAGAVGARARSVMIADAVGTVVQVLLVRWAGDAVGPLPTGASLIAAAATTAVGFAVTRALRHPTTGARARDRQPRDPVTA